MNNLPTLEQRIAAALTLDPATVIDAAKVGASVATAELTRDRLRAALPRLQERLKQAREREYAECCLTRCDQGP